MKFMKRKTFDTEMKIADAQGEVRETRALNWTYVSMGLIIVTFISFILVFVLFRDSFVPDRSEPNNTSGRPQTP